MRLDHTPYLSLPNHIATSHSFLTDIKIYFIPFQNALVVDVIFTNSREEELGRNKQNLGWPSLAKDFQACLSTMWWFLGEISKTCWLTLATFVIYFMSANNRLEVSPNYAKHQMWNMVSLLHTSKHYCIIAQWVIYDALVYTKVY